MIIKIGTRASKLALWQAEDVAERIKAAGGTPEIIKISTKGDKILDKALSKIGSKGVFTEELEAALRSHDIDIAVHSAKDLPSELDNDLPIVAFTDREKANDVLVSFNKNISLEDEIVVGTSSTRRVALLKHYYPKVKVVNMRGNLQTRFAKMEKGDCDAMILAYAGIHRMAFDERIAAMLPENIFTPPAGQGCMAIQCHDGIDREKRELLRDSCNNELTERCLTAERAFLKTMNGGCSIPTYAMAVLQGDLIVINGGIVSLDGTKMVRHTVVKSSTEAVVAGVELARRVLDDGGDEILSGIRAAQANDKD